MRRFMGSVMRLLLMFFESVSAIGNCSEDVSACWMTANHPSQRYPIWLKFVGVPQLSVSNSIRQLQCNSEGNASVYQESTARNFSFHVNFDVLVVHYRVSATIRLETKWKRPAVIALSYQHWLTNCWRPEIMQCPEFNLVGCTIHVHCITAAGLCNVLSNRIADFTTPYTSVISADLKSLWECSL
jgi:hypothetical protein